MKKLIISLTLAFITLALGACGQPVRVGYGPASIAFGGGQYWQPQQQFGQPRNCAVQPRSYGMVNNCGAYGPQQYNDRFQTPHGPQSYHTTTTVQIMTKGCTNPGKDPQGFLAWISSGGAGMERAKGMLKSGHSKSEVEATLNQIMHQKFGRNGTLYVLVQTSGASR